MWMEWLRTAPRGKWWSGPHFQTLGSSPKPLPQRLSEQSTPEETRQIQPGQFKLALPTSANL